MGEQNNCQHSNIRGRRLILSDEGFWCDRDSPMNPDGGAHDPSTGPPVFYAECDPSQVCDELEQRIASDAVKITELEAERSTCEACGHVRLFENLNTPCPYCIIDELQEKLNQRFGHHDEAPYWVSEADGSIWTQHPIEGYDHSLDERAIAERLCAMAYEIGAAAKAATDNNLIDDCEHDPECMTWGECAIRQASSQLTTATQRIAEIEVGHAEYWHDRDPESILLNDHKEIVGRDEAAIADLQCQLTTATETIAGLEVEGDTATQRAEAAEALVERVKVEAQYHAMESRGQRAIVNEVGQQLSDNGSVPDYGPIVAGVKALRECAEAAEADHRAGETHGMDPECKMMEGRSGWYTRGFASGARMARAVVAEAEAERLVEIIARYGRHDIDCTDEDDCACGLAALTAPEAG